VISKARGSRVTHTTGAELCAEMVREDIQVVARERRRNAE
jgi:hypothetical protein